MNKFYFIGAAVAFGLLVQGVLLAKAYHAGYNEKGNQDAAVTATEAANKFSERSKLDAKIPDMDSATVCREFGYKWLLSDDGKFHCTKV